MKKLALILVALALMGLIGAGLTLRASLPQLDGERPVAGLAGPVTIERDALGVVTITADSRRDLAFATGFVHAQDRFFQMDLARRAAAGELAELLGPAVIEVDRRVRLHGFRQVARQVLERAAPAERDLAEAYADGVNASLAASGSRSFEYFLLRASPRPWESVDSVLVAFSMYLDLNDSTGARELERSQLERALPAELFAFLYPPGGEWDAPIAGGPLTAAGLPGPAVVDLRNAKRPARVAGVLEDLGSELLPVGLVGSNNWAVAGSHTSSGIALLANDMHLPLRIPNVWYRARLVVQGDGNDARDLAGVTLPGVPTLIAGSNGRVAWGFTNSYGDWSDLVLVDPDPADPGRYLGPDGPLRWEVRTEWIRVRGQPDENLEVRSTIWGPIIGRTTDDHWLALAWTAHRPEATNLAIGTLETVDSVAEALISANRVGAPVQNFLAADDRGHIGWTLMGQVPKRGRYDPSLPASWREPGSGWMGWQAPKDYPRILDPVAGRLWTANARTVDGHWLEFIGDGGYDLGARATQIRDALLTLAEATPADMLAIQTDDRALFLERWRTLLLELLDEDAVLAGHSLRARARALVERSSARAATADVGYRIVKSFRARVAERVYMALTASADEANKGVGLRLPPRFEIPLWQLVTERPRHLLDPQYSTWSQALLSWCDESLQALERDCGSLERCTWGRRNALRMQHPLSPALPWARRWLDMPAEPLPGDDNMPRVQAPGFGASERFAVSPGREHEGYFHMPGGQSAHPLSEYYRAGHEAWVHGQPVPFLPGPAEHRLQLVPQ